MTSLGFERLYVDDNGTKWCWCSREQTHKPCDEFSVSRKSKNGYQHICRECMRKSTSYKRREDHYENPKDLEIAHELLRNIGYDTESGVPITKQFHTKYNLPQ